MKRSPGAGFLHAVAPRKLLEHRSGDEASRDLYLPIEWSTVTGPRILGDGEWLAQKHKTKGIRRCWRKLHLGLNEASGWIVCADRTHDNVGDRPA